MLKIMRSGEVMPDDLIKKIQNSKYFNTGFDNVELLAASMLDMAYYTLEAPVNIELKSLKRIISIKLV